MRQYICYMALGTCHISCIADPIQLNGWARGMRRIGFVVVAIGGV
jgi:hypothetical protein